jgi:ribosomal protein S18 acetylase RimI-like enzyme
MGRPGACASNDGALELGVTAISDGHRDASAEGRLGPRLRQYDAADFDAVSRICTLTAEGGGDATGLYVSDELMPDVFVRPYVVYQPELSFVVEDEQGVAGYIVGVADTSAFTEWFSREWIPREIAGRYEHTQPVVSKDDLIRHLAFWPERMLIAELDEYPAHLHIDLLPRAQGAGWGRRLVDTLADALRARGVPGLHLSMDAANTNARAFYDRIGFTELPSSTADAPLLGLRL